MAVVVVGGLKSQHEKSVFPLMPFLSFGDWPQNNKEPLVLLFVHQL